MTPRKHDLYYYLSIIVLIALLILWAWWAGNRDAQIDKVDGQALYHRAHVLAMERGE